jgi:hypothetical protein
MSHCTEKMAKVTQRVGMRFTENQAEKLQLEKLNAANK